MRLGIGIGIGIGGSGSWTPAQLGGDVKLWVKARRGETINTVPPDQLAAASDLSAAQRGISQANAHNLSQATPSKQPLVGTTGAQEDALWRFEGAVGGAGDHLFAASGTPAWSGSTDHTLALLVNQRDTAATNQQVFDAETGRLTFTIGSAGQAQVGYWDAVNSFVSIAPSVLGWQVLIWQMDNTGVAAKMWRHTASGLSYLGTGPYAGTALGGIVTLGTNFVGGASASIDLHEGLYLDALRESDIPQIANYLVRQASANNLTLA